VAPTSFLTLLEQIIPNGSLKDYIEKLTRRKSLVAELDFGDHILVISDLTSVSLRVLNEDQK
jgi:predicted nucleotidyltransferase